MNDQAFLIVIYLRIFHNVFSTDTDMYVFSINFATCKGKKENWFGAAFCETLT